MHTPGSWRRRPLTLSIEGPDGRLIANALCGTMRRTATSPPERPRAEAEANARLIAAAPELLAALRAMLDDFGADDKGPTIDAARAAIAKAEAV